MNRLSPGLAQACFEILRYVSHTRTTFGEIRSAFASIGGMESSKVLTAAQSLQWLVASGDGIAEVTASGVRLLDLTSYQDMLRQALLDYVDVERPPWVQNATYGRARVLAFAGNEIGQVFVEAGLVGGTEAGVVAFWDMLQARARGQKNDQLTAIGRQGERYTIAYEIKRTGHPPKWISIDDNADGYDVLSIIERGDHRPLSIEVKASTMGLRGTFHLTRTEWNRSQEVDRHIFHLWDIKDQNRPAIAVLTPEEMREHMPCDNGGGVWELVEVPFDIFQKHFVSVPSM